MPKSKAIRFKQTEYIPRNSAPPEPCQEQDRGRTRQEWSCTVFLLPLEGQWKGRPKKTRPPKLQAQNSLKQGHARTWEWERNYKWKPTSFLMDFSRSMSLGSIRRSLSSLSSLKQFISTAPLRSSPLCSASWPSFSDPAPSMPNVSVSHLDQFPTYTSVSWLSNQPISIVWKEEELCCFLGMQLQA